VARVPDHGAAQMAQPPPRADAEARTRSTYLVDGRLIAIPTQRTRVITILEALVRDFAYGQRYSETEVNAIPARERRVYRRVGDGVGEASAL
jgi:hypothetical protein